MTAVSYVVTVFNKAPYLWRTASALLAQNGEFSKEYIFVDDGSTDDSPRILSALANLHPDVQVIRQANRGPAAALNVGLARARGRFIKPMDGDDELAPHATEALLAALARSQVDVAYANFYRQAHFDPRDPAATAQWPSREAGLSEAARATAPVMRGAALAKAILKPNIRPSSMIATAAALRGAGLCDEGVFVQDYSLELRLALRHDMAVIDAPIYRLPRAAPGRLSDNCAQTLHDVNLALARFVAESPSLPEPLRRFALQRAAGRAWKWAKRELGRSMVSCEFFRYVASRARALAPTAERFEATCAPFRAQGRVRRVANAMLRPAEPEFAVARPALARRLG